MLPLTGFQRRKAVHSGRRTFAVPVVSDAIAEGAEGFRLKAEGTAGVGNCCRGLVGADAAVSEWVAITDGTTPPGLSVSSPTVQEGGDLEFVIVLTGVSGSVGWVTLEGTADSSDFTSLIWAQTTSQQRNSPPGGGAR